MPSAALRADVRAVLLDGLGTLVALDPPWPGLARQLRIDCGLQIAEVDAERAFRAEMAYYRAHHHEGHDENALADLRRRCAEVLLEELPQTIRQTLSLTQLTAAMLGALRFSAYPDAPVALEALRARGLILVVISNWDVSLVRVLEETGLAGLLDGVLTSAAVGRPKPGRAIFEAGLTLAGVAAHEAVHVGDSVAHDVLGARGAGIEPILLVRGDGDSVEAPAGVATIVSLTDLLA
jgi:putative hydrolase of the HAD superfamily